MDKAEKAITKIIKVEYEIPPMRAIYSNEYHDDG